MYIGVYPNIYASAVSDVCCRRKKVKAFRMALVSWRCNRSTFKHAGCPSPSWGTRILNGHWSHWSRKFIRKWGHVWLPEGNTLERSQKGMALDLSFFCWVARPTAHPIGMQSEMWRSYNRGKRCTRMLHKWSARNMLGKLNENWADSISECSRLLKMKSVFAFRFARLGCRCHDGRTFYRFENWWQSPPTINGSTKCVFLFFAAGWSMQKYHTPLSFRGEMGKALNYFLLFWWVTTLDISWHSYNKLWPQPNRVQPAFC